MHLLLDLDLYCDTDILGMFPLFLKRTADAMALVVVLCSGCLFVWVVYRLAGDRPMSTEFQKVHCPPLLIITDRFSYYQFI